MTLSEKYSKKTWMPAVMNHLKQNKIPLTYTQIVDNAVMLSIMPKKTLRQSNRCPSKKGFFKVMSNIDGVETFKEGQFRYWRLVE